MAASFGRAILREHDGRSRDEGRTRRFTPEAYESGVEFLRRFRETAGSGDFDEPITFAERQFGEFVGRSPRQVLEALESQG
jgi:hypothetical protein